MRKVVFPISGTFIGAAVTIVLNLLSAAIQRRALTDQFTDLTIVWLVIFAVSGLIIGVILSNQGVMKMDKKSNHSNRAQGLIAGGNITINQFTGGDISQSDQMAYFIKQLGLENSRPSAYMQSQFEAYCNVWKSLQLLRLLGNDLWEEASSSNISKFAKQLRIVELLVREDELFFEEYDRRDLLELLSAFAKFRFGKSQLIEIRSVKDVVNNNEPHEISKLIEYNRQMMQRYEQLLDSIRRSFRQRLLHHDH